MLSLKRFLMTRHGLFFFISLVTSSSHLYELWFLLEKPVVIRCIAFLLHLVHDDICLFLPSWFTETLYLIMTSHTNRQKIHFHVQTMNIMYGVVMTSFAYYKRCVLTLWYNHLLGLNMCRRYVPVWQRVLRMIHMIHVVIGDTDTCQENPYMNTYLWLNDQILFSFMIVILNCFVLVLVTTSAQDKQCCPYRQQSDVNPEGDGVYRTTTAGVVHNTGNPHTVSNVCQ